MEYLAFALIMTAVLTGLFWWRGHVGRNPAKSVNDFQRTIQALGSRTARRRAARR